MISLPPGFDPVQFFSDAYAIGGLLIPLVVAMMMFFVIRSAIKGIR